MRWLNEASLQFLQRDYLLPGETIHERIDVICNAAERILGVKGFAKRFKDNLAKGWYSLSTPIWCNFGTDRGMPISCFGSMIEDSMESILYTLAEVGMMTKHGGGTSTYVGKLRPRGSTIRNNGESSGSVHFSQLFNSLIPVISQGSCYIEGTEVLTNSGFKDFRDVLPSDKIAELDEFNNVSFTDKYELVVQDFDGDLVCLDGKKRDDSVSIKVTPNHRMVVSRRKMENRQRFWPHETDIVTAEHLNLHRDNRLILAGWSGDGKGLDDWDRLRIAFQADGIKDGPNRKIRFHFSKQRKIERIKDILSRLSIEYTEYLNIDGTLDINLEYNPSVKHNTFASWVKLDRITGRWAEEFIDELTYWDGSYAHGGAVVYCSVIRQNIDIVQAIASLADKKTRISMRPAKDNRQNLHRICISEGAYRGGEAIKKSREYYNGKVYCAIVPKGRLLVRYQDRVMVCGNTRRGNIAVYLPVDHPDIMEFLTIKSDGSPIQDVSFGVCVPDYWMEEMVGDSTPTGGDAEKRKVWARVLEVRANTGYPYILFTDNANKGAPDVYKDNKKLITHSNLCSEIMLPDTYDESFVCDLSSMNVLYFDEWKDTDAVELMTMFLDAVMTEFVEKAGSIPFMERPVRFAKNHRALGIGQLGWHSYLQSKMIPFESFEAKLLNTKIAKTIKESAYAASEKMVRELGFEAPAQLVPYGRRNTTLIAIAPTKSSAFILGQVSEGIEPNKSNYFIKDLAKGKFTMKNQYLCELLNKKGKDTDDVWKSILERGGSVQHLEFLSEHEKAVFKTFSEISPKEIIIQAAQRQKFIDQSQSLNLMIHPSVHPRDVNMLLIEAWRLGVKSLYYQMSVNAAQQFARNILECSSCEG